MKKKNKGITLIALVITIIVLLILAGVSIATLGGENGIISRARTAKTKTQEAQAEEEAISIGNEYEMYKKACETEGRQSSVKNFLDTNYKDKYEEDNGKFKILTDSGNEVKMDDNGNIEVNGNIFNAKNIEGIEISGEKLVDVGSTITLTAKASKEGGTYKDIKWNCSDTDKATVTGNGMLCEVTGSQIGKVTITCKITNYDESEISNTYEVDVINNLAKVLGNTSSGKGKYVQYSAGGVSSWRVFYLESDIVYIITKLAVYPTRVGTNADTTVSYMTDTSNWTSYVNDKFAESATGGPTYDQFNKSLGYALELWKSVSGDLYGNSNWRVAHKNSSNDIIIVYYGYVGAFSYDSAYGSGNVPIGYRPLVKLKSGIKVSGGDGTESNPYVLLEQ